MPSTPSLEQARTGREFGLLRLAAGLSQRSVAARIGTTHDTLRRWESDRLPLPLERVNAWRTAIAQLSQARAASLARQGYTSQELAHSDLGRVLVQAGRVLAS